MQQDEEETNEQKLERLTAALRIKRMKSTILEAEAELAGGPQTLSIDFAGLPIRSKRPASDSPDDDRPSYRHARLATPPTYGADSIREMEIFELGWKTQLEALPHFTDEQNIRRAATFLVGGAREMWGRRTVVINTWQEFMTWCRGLVADPVNRLHYSLLRLKEIQQRPTQTVRNLVNIIESLERDVPRLTREEQLAWCLLNALRPDTRIEVLRENKEINSREQVLAAAQRYEELGARERAYPRAQDRPYERSQDKGKAVDYFADAAQEPFARETHANRGGFPYRGVRGRIGHKGYRRSNNGYRSISSYRGNYSYRGGSTEKGENSKAIATCFNCHKVGHWASECRAPKPSEKGGSSSSGPSKN